MKNILGRAHDKGITVEVSINNKGSINVGNTTRYERDFKFCITIWLPGGAKIVDSKDIVLKAIERENMSRSQKVERMRLEELWENGLTKGQAFLIASKCVKFLSGEQSMGVDTITWSEIMDFFNEAMFLENNLYKEDGQ